MVEDTLHDRAWMVSPAAMAELMTPALAVDLDRVRRNVAREIALAGGPERWRPHVKTAKISAVLRELVRSGVRQFKCATTREAVCLLEVLRDEGVAGGDLLLAYPLVGPGLIRLGRIAEQYAEARLSVLVETAASVPELPANVDGFIDINPGMHRTGVLLDGEDGARRVGALAARLGARFRGLHYYDGHHSQADPEVRRAAIHAGYESLLELVRTLGAAGTPVREAITAGTPAFLEGAGFRGFTSEADLVHRLSPGTVVYHDLRTERENPALGLEPAALVHARVVSHPRAGRVTCDAGSKAVAFEGRGPHCLALGRPELEAETPNEEHLPLRIARGARTPERGELLALFPWHVCPTVNLADEAVLVEDGRVLGVVPVSARGHELRL